MHYKKLKKQNKLYKDLFNMYEDLYHTAAKELKFQRLQTEHLESILYEVQELNRQKVNPVLVNRVIDNGIERKHLDQLIHADIIFK
jgi:hypothetical protein